VQQLGRHSEHTNVHRLHSHNHALIQTIPLLQSAAAPHLCLAGHAAARDVPHALLLLLLLLLLPLLLLPLPQC
jgi:hypothetical protein